MLNGFKSAFAVLGTLLTWLLGGWDVTIQILAVFVVLDYITGLSASYITKRLNSDRGRRGILRKIGIFICVIVATMLDLLLNTENVFRTIAIMFFIANEGISILENLGLMGVPIPKRLKDALEQLKGDYENNKNDDATR